MRISFSKTHPASRSGRVRVRFFSKEDTDRIRRSLKKADTDPFSQAVRGKHFKGEYKNVLVLFGAAGGETLVAAGLGEHKDFTVHRLRNASAAVCRRLKKLKAPRAAVELYLSEGASEDDCVSALLEGLLLGDYVFERKSKKNGSPALQVTLSGVRASRARTLLDEAKSVCGGVRLARELVNENADVMTPERMAREARRVAKHHGFPARVFDEKKLKAMGCRLHLAVGRGAANPPRLAVLEYKKGGRGAKTLAMVGKGITFDSGGLNVKPTGHMEDMRLDMAGAAAVLGAMEAIAALKLKVNVVGVMACAENAVGSRAYKPGDILVSYSGKTVEVLNTDAEGRLVLADALAYTEKTYRPDYLIDLATLTGAALIATGTHYAPLLTRDDDFRDRIQQAARETDDRVWPLPMDCHYLDEMKSDVADVRNMGRNRHSGTIRGAVFLHHFVCNTPWAHLDIAGTAWSWSPGNHDFVLRYATGYGVRLLTRLAQIIS